MNKPSDEGRVFPLERLVGPDERTAFERWISAPPFEHMCDRFPTDTGAWPGRYRRYETELAWEAWKERAGLRQPVTAQCTKCGWWRSRPFQDVSACADPECPPLPNAGASLTECREQRPDETSKGRAA